MTEAGVNVMSVVFSTNGVVGVNGTGVGPGLRGVAADSDDADGNVDRWLSEEAADNSRETSNFNSFFSVCGFPVSAL